MIHPKRTKKYVRPNVKGSAFWLNFQHWGFPTPQAMFPKRSKKHPLKLLSKVAGLAVLHFIQQIIIF